MSRNTDPKPTTYAEWEDLEEERDQLRADRDRLASELQATRAELERVRRNHLRRMAEATRERSWKLQLEMVSRGRVDATPHKRIIAEMSRFAERCRAALASMETRV